VKISVVIPEHQDKYLVAQKSRKTGKPRRWTVNGQSLYNATLHYRLRGKITKYFHEYLSKYIREQISEENIRFINIAFQNSMKLGISVDIYEVKRGKMPDIGNMWLWIKWFEDALQDCGIIPDDNPDYVEESGRKRYHWIDTVQERRLVFNIYFLKQSTHE
jgi:hypothetical protein